MTTTYTVRCFNQYYAPDDEVKCVHRQCGLSYEEALELRDEWAGISEGNYAKVTDEAGGDVPQQRPASWFGGVGEPA